MCHCRRVRFVPVRNAAYRMVFRSFARPRIPCFPTVYPLDSTYSSFSYRSQDDLEGLAKKTHGDQETAQNSKPSSGKITLGVLLVQGVATSIDALSVGFTIADYTVLSAIVSSLIIGIVTFLICIAGLVFGKKLGEKFSDKATVIGGFILIGIGIEIFIKSFL